MNGSGELFGEMLKKRKPQNWEKKLFQCQSAYHKSHTNWPGTDARAPT